MLNILLAPVANDAVYYLYLGLSIALIVLMLIVSILAIIFVMMQPPASEGIDALSGSSDTFFGKNKGNSIEARLKKWTAACLIILGVLAIIFFVLQFDGIWGK